jgi:hypothetical protein
MVAIKRGKSHARELEEAAVNHQPPAIATSREVAAVFNTTEQALAQRRFRGQGPPFVKAGRSVYYRWCDVNAWLDANLHEQNGVTAGSEPAPGSAPATIGAGSRCGTREKGTGPNHREPVPFLTPTHPPPSGKERAP